MKKPTVVTLWYWKGTSLGYLQILKPVDVEICYITWNSLCSEFVYILPEAVMHHTMMFLSVMDSVYSRPIRLHHQLETWSPY